MIKPQLHPSFRLSIGLIALTISILLVGELLGFMSNNHDVTINARKTLSETLAVQFTLSAERKEFDHIETALRLLIKRNPEILSAAMRDSKGSFYAIAGDHEAIWQDPADGGSLLSNIQVPIMQANELWGTVELSYQPQEELGSWNQIKDSFWGTLLFVTIFGFLGYFIYLKQALRELDPSKVIPTRVRTAFDTLTVGILMLDEQGYIVLANSAFCQNIGLSFDYLIGKKATNLNWESVSVNQTEEERLFPWSETLKNGEAQTNVRLCFNTDDGHVNIFTVNCTPILGDKDQCKGALVSFDDVTELEDKNSKLQTSLEKLEILKDKILHQNNELKILSEIDPLTGCFNRRAFQTYLEMLFSAAHKKKLDLTCIMLDIDHFKSVNDNYGHQTGDEVIKLVTTLIRKNMRNGDILGRYGGEEFCLVLPDLDNEEALKIAERIRLGIMKSSEYDEIGIKGVTISLGLSSIKDKVQNTSKMIELADSALYYAKKNGRNRTVVWSKGVENDPVTIEDQITSDNPIESDESFLQGADPSILHEKIKKLENLSSVQKKVLNYKLNYDPLTGLPNRLLLLDRLNGLISYAQRNKNKIAVLSLSFNDYKRIQNTLGYKTAEKLIIELSMKLGGVLRATDIVSSELNLSRKNDDGFYILIPELKKEESITWIMNRIYSVLALPIKVAKFNIKMDTAIGVSVFPIDGQDPESLLRYADQARHYAETQGKNNCQFYSNKMNDLFTTQLEMESELEHAIKSNQFEMHYQPIVNAITGEISKVEALLRWNHPEKNFTSALHFIEVAEQSGQIIAIGDWVLRETIQQLAVWQKEISRDICIAVNISAVQLRQDDLVKNILTYLQENNVPPQNLILEITESSVVQNMDKAIGIMEQLHEKGIQIALDDFGTGYSSLQYLQKFPVDIIKIDRSFVNNLESNEGDASIVSLVIDIAKKLGFSTVGEGVETEVQFERLRELGCDNIQGYLISRPIPKLPISEMLQNHEPFLNKIESVDKMVALK